METSIHTFQIQLSSQAHKSFTNDLENKGIQFSSITRSSLIVKNTPKVREAIQLLEDRFGSNSIYITNAEC